MNIPFEILSLFSQCFVYFPVLYVIQMSVVGSPANPVWVWGLSCIHLYLKDTPLAIVPYIDWHTTSKLESVSFLSWVKTLRWASRILDKWSVQPWMLISQECSTFLIHLATCNFPVPHSRSVSGDFNRFLKNLGMPTICVGNKIYYSFMSPVPYST